MKIVASDELIRDVFDKTRDELIDVIDRHTVNVQAWLASRSPQAATFQGKGIRASSTGFKLPLLNLALGWNFSPDIGEAEIEDEIEAVKAFFAARHVPWYWWTRPSSEQRKKIMQRHGLEHEVHPFPAMLATLEPGRYSLPGFPGKIHVWAAHTLDDLKAASKIRRTAFNFPNVEALTYFEDMASDWLQNKNVALFLAGERETEPVSMGALIHEAGIPGVYAMATLPEHHRKGYGKAILTRLMTEATSNGHSHIALTASHAGYGLYSQFGFHYIYDVEAYTLSR